MSKENNQKAEILLASLAGLIMQDVAFSPAPEREDEIKSILEQLYNVTTIVDYECNRKIRSRIWDISEKYPDKLFLHQITFLLNNLNFLKDIKIDTTDDLFNVGSPGDNDASKFIFDCASNGYFKAISQKGYFRLSEIDYSFDSTSTDQKRMILSFLINYFNNSCSKYLPDEDETTHMFHLLAMLKILSKQLNRGLIFYYIFNLFGFVIFKWTIF